MTNETHMLLCLLVIPYGAVLIGMAIIIIASRFTGFGK